MHLLPEPTADLAEIQVRTMCQTVQEPSSVCDAKRCDGVGHGSSSTAQVMIACTPSASNTFCCSEALRLARPRGPTYREGRFMHTDSEPQSRKCTEPGNGVAGQGLIWRSERDGKAKF